MYYPDLYSSYAALNQTSSSSTTPTSFNYPQYGTSSTSDQYSGAYQYGANQNQYSSTTTYPSQNLNQYGASSTYPQYGNTSTYSISTPASTSSYTAQTSSNWDPSTPLSIGGTTTTSANYSSSGYQSTANYSSSSYQSSGNYSSSGYQNSGNYTSPGYQNSGNYSSAGYQSSGNYSGSGNHQSGNNYSGGGAGSSGGGGAGGGDLRGIKLTKVTPFKTDHLYNCPNNGQPIQCTTCDVIMPSYSIASVHFNSPKHHRKRMNELHYPSEKRRKLVEISETDPDAIKMECTVCAVKPGSYDGFLSHMASFKHIKKLNNIGPETKTFNITCEPCDEKINTIEHLSMHVNMKCHMKDVAKKLKEQFPDLKDDASQWHCAACNKSCNSMQTFDAHCASVKHRNKVKLFENQKFELEFEQVELPEQFEKLEQLQQSGQVEKSSEEPPPPPPPPQRPPKPLKIDKEVPIPDLYQCKVCNFGTSDKYLIDKHYETASHRANKLLKRRHDELYRVADVAKRDHKGVNLGDIVPLNAKGAERCDICELSFAHTLLLEVHKRGRLHKEMESKLETEHDKIQTQSQNKEEAPVGVLASTVKPAPVKPHQKGGHHCDACNVHTSCLTRYLAHVSSKDHRKMMAQLARSGVPASAPADSSQKCELRATALAPPAPKRPVPSTWQQPQNQSQSFSWQANKRNKFEDSINNNKKKKKKNPSQSLRINDYLHGLPPDGIPPEAVREDGRFECKLCAVVVQQEHAYIQHCQGRKHLSKTNIGAESSAGATGPKNNTEVFFCKMCNVSCPTGADTLAHLSSKEHTQGPGLNVAKEDKKETDGDKKDDKKEENELDPSEIINKFFCAVCNLDCRTESSFNLHMKGIKHTKKLTALTDEAETVMSKVDCGNSAVRKNLSCAKCEVHCKSIVNYEQHCASQEHKAKTSRVRFPISTSRGRSYNAGRNWSLPNSWHQNRR